MFHWGLFVTGFGNFFLSLLAALRLRDLAIAVAASECKNINVFFTECKIDEAMLIIKRKLLEVLL